MRSKFFIVLALFSSLVITGCATSETPEPTSGDEPTVQPTTNQKYSIKFYDENNKLYVSKICKEGDIPSCSYKDYQTNEYNFYIKWSLTPGGEPLDAIPPATQDQNYYAVVTKEQRVYTVTYLDPDGKILVEENYHYGDKIQTINYPRESDEMYNVNFRIWIEAASNTYIYPNTEITVESDMTFKPVISITYKEFTITFVTDTYKNNPKYEYHYNVKYNDLITPPSAEDVTVRYSEGYDPSTHVGHLIGWTKDPNVQNPVLETEFTFFVEDTIYYPVFSFETRYYPVNFFDNDGNLLESKQYQFGEQISIEFPEEENYTTEILGWKKSPESENIISSLPKAGLSYYQENIYLQLNRHVIIAHIKFYMDSITNEDNFLYEEYVPYGTEVKIRDEYQTMNKGFFTYKYPYLTTSSGIKINYDTTTVLSDESYSISYRDSFYRTITINYHDIDGISNENKLLHEYSYDDFGFLQDTISLPQAKKEGCVFLGWYLDAERTIKVESLTKDEPITDLYPLWDTLTPEIVLYPGARGAFLKYYAVYNFHYNDDRMVDDSRSILSQTKIELPIMPIFEDKSFAGWYTDPELTHLYDYSHETKTIVNLYAKWSDCSGINPDDIIEVNQTANGLVYGDSKNKDYSMKKNKIYVKWNDQSSELMFRLNFVDFSQYGSIKTYGDDDETPELIKSEAIKIGYLNTYMIPLNHACFPGELFEINIKGSELGTLNIFGRAVMPEIDYVFVETFYREYNDLSPFPISVHLDDYDYVDFVFVGYESIYDFSEYDDLTTDEFGVPLRNFSVEKYLFEPMFTSTSVYGN